MSHSCGGSCTGCSGCGRSLELSQPELSILYQLGQIPFLPVARRADDMTPIFLELSDYPVDQYSLFLQLMEKKGLITLDYDAPLQGVDMAAYKGYPVHGSMALTARGQSVLEFLEIQGITEN